jgi:hypothetical protein
LKTIVFHFHPQRPTGATGLLEQRNDPGLERQLAGGSQKGVLGQMNEQVIESQCLATIPKNSRFDVDKNALSPIIHKVK